MFDKSMFDDLVNMMERELNLGLISKEEGINKFLIRSGDKAIADDKITQINFRFKKDKLIIPILYLSTANKGIGTKIMQWFVTFCKGENIKLIEVRNVKQDNINMRRLLESARFSFHIINNEECLDYRMKITH